MCSHTVYSNTTIVLSIRDKISLFFNVFVSKKNMQHVTHFNSSVSLTVVGLQHIWKFLRWPPMSITVYYSSSLLYT